MDLEGKSPSAAGGSAGAGETHTVVERQQQPTATADAANSPQPDTNFGFLLAMFGKDHANNALVISFAEDPTAKHEPRTRARMWKETRWGAQKKPPDHTNNNYACISTFKPSEDPKDYSEPRRRKALHHATHAIVFDDCGDGQKVPWQNIKLPPTCVIETSKGNHQAWFRLSAPEHDAGKVERLLDGLVAKGLAIDGKDPGMRGVTRVVRLPFGTNRKAKYGPGGVQGRITDWHPERAYTCEEIADAHRVSLEPPIKRDARPSLNITDEQQKAVAESMLAALDAENRIIGEDPNAPGKWHIVCPWVEEHTDRDDSGTAYFEPGYVDRSAGTASQKGGFRCHHSHGDRKHLHELVNWLRERGHNEIIHPSVAAEFNVVVTEGQRLPAEMFEALEREDEKILPRKVRNQEIIIFHDNLIRNSIRFNVFTQRAEFPLYPRGRTLDAWVSEMQAEIERTYGVTFSATDINLRLHRLLELVSYDPLLEWALATYERWDGKRRARRMLIEHAFATAQPPEYVEAVTWAFMLGAAHRALTPGYKFDHMLILEGLTGIRKSSLVKCITPCEEWYATGSLNVENKDAVADLLGKFIYEMDELEAFRRAKDFEAIRAFLSRVSDRVRLPYRRDSADYPRRVVFIGTTEKDQYLPDGEHGTAQRRFWPVSLTATQAAPIDTDWFLAHREQLWAEALFAAVVLGEQPSLVGAIPLVEAEQKLRAHTPEEHPWYETLVKLWNDGEIDNRWPERISGHDALHRVGVPTDRQTRANEQVMGKVLRSLGYKRILTTDGGRRARVWVREPNQ